MDSTRGITIALYALLGIVTLLVLLRMTRPADVGLEAAAARPLDESSTFSAAGLEARRLRQENFAAELQSRDERITRLETQLQQQNAAARNLKAQLDQAQARLEMAGATQTTDPSQNQESSPGTATRTASAGPSPNPNATTPAGPPRGDLEVAAALEQARLAEVERLRAQLQQTEQTLAQLRDEAEDELQRLEQQEQLMQSAATDALVRAGTAAVPGLITLLQDRSPLVREWSAYVLGQLGSDATDAIDELEDLDSDPDPLVRDAARDALRRIENTN